MLSRSESADDIPFGFCKLLHEPMFSCGWPMSSAVQLPFMIGVRGRKCGYCENSGGTADVMCGKFELNPAAGEGQELGKGCVAMEG